MAVQNEIGEFRETGYTTPDQPGGIPGWYEGIPVMRILTCGPFTVEILQEVPEGNPALARYAKLPSERLHGRGPGPALILLKLLINREGRFAPKDWLMTHLREGKDTSITEKRLENILSLLRGLLVLPSGKKLQDLIVYVRATQDSGDGYRLASFPLVWLDIDALAWNAQQATLKERFHDDPWPYWQRAYALASRGRFLIEEPTSDWAKARREAIEDLMRQCVHALARLSLARFGQAGEEEVMRMLSPYCRMHRLDEDALRPLLELLCKRGRYQEALEWYDCLEAAQEQAGLTKTGKVRTPHPLTAEIAAFARLKQRESRQAENAVASTSGGVSGIRPGVGDGMQRPDGSVSVVSSIVHAPPLPPFSALLEDFDWDDFDESEATRETSTIQDNIARRLKLLLDNPTFFGEHLANKLAPLLQHILEKYLSNEARLVLNRLAVASIPLGKPALRMLCPHLDLLKELHHASLLAAYTNRIQLLPVVAWTVQQQLAPEQRREVESVVIEALKKWLYDENIQSDDAGNVVAELVTLQLRHHHLVGAAELVLYHGWLSFKLGHGPRLAHIAQEVLHDFDWHSTDENECVGLVLIQLLFPFLGKPVVTREYGDYQRMYESFLAGKMVLPLATEQYVVRLLLKDAINHVQFERAQGILDAYGARITACRPFYLKRQTALLTERVLLFGIWCEYMEEQGEQQKAQELRKETILLYRQRVILGSSLEEKTSIIRDFQQKSLGSDLSYLGYHLHRAGQHEEARKVLERAILLQEQGYAYTGVLASSYSDQSQVLIALGRFQEALLFDKKAVAEIHRCADEGDGISLEEIPIYYVNRGRLYLRLGRVDEAEQMLAEALPRISKQRRKYRMFAREALEEIKQWRQHAVAPQHQLDWRWIGRFRGLVAYDGFWWLTGAGPFTTEEQQEWNRLFALSLDRSTKEQLGTLMKASRERELKAALEEQREPRLHYPAIPIEDIRRRIAGLLQLGTDIQQQEPNAIVRRLYQEVIEEDVDYLRMIEATSEGNTERFWECSQHVFTSPSVDEVNYALTQITRLIRQGLAKPGTADISLQLEEILRTRFQLSFDLAQDEDAENREIQSTTPSLPSQANRKVSAQTAKRFFEAVLRESGYDEWQVVIEPGAIHPWIESGLHMMVLSEQQFTLEDIKYLLTHELAGHAARSMAGEHSLLGLLGIQTKNYQPTEEGLLIYYEHQEALRHGLVPSSKGAEWSAFAVGLASGVITPPQTFLSVATFFELLVLLYGLLKWPDAEMQKARTPVGVYARTYGLMMALRVFRGVPDLSHAGVCFLQDAMYLRGMRLIQQAVAEDATVLDRLAVGKCALDQLPDLQELGIVAPPQSLRKLVDVTDLYDYMLSFEQED